VRRITITLGVVLLALSAVTIQAQETGPALRTVPVAVNSQAYCTGFIANPDVPRNLFVVGGADDNFHSTVRQFVEGDSIFISTRKGESISVGTEYSVVRPATELFRTRNYSGERGAIRKLGKPYEDIGRVKVTHANPDGTVATVTSSCDSIIPGDTLVPFQPRAIPEYTLSAPLDHFAPLNNNKQHGLIAATRDNYGYLGAETVVYLNLGENEGAKAGERFRIYEVLAPHPTGFLTSQRTPAETVGEAVVLSVQSKSCVALVVSSYREISAGDRVEAE
jgi:hypothetical protein